MKQGFSLVELLVVLAVLGIVVAIGTTTFLGFRQTTEIQEAQSQFAQDLERVRQFARRYSVNYIIKTPSTTTYEAYALKADGTQDTTVPAITLRTLPNQAVFNESPASGSEPTYTGPFGRADTGPTNDCYSVKIASSGKFAEIHLVGTTGRITPRAVRTTGSPCA
jgi:type IV pilus assembly protein PilA